MNARVRNKIYLKLKWKPFENEWFITAGGRSVIQNHHFVTHRNQRYVMDISKIVNGQLFSGSGTQNEDYYSFGKRLNAPGNGKVKALENNVEDNIPGTVNTEQELGNFIINRKTKNVNNQNSYKTFGMFTCLNGFECWFWSRRDCKVKGHGSEF